VGGLERYLTSVDKIEVYTGLDFFPDMPDETEAALESQAAASLWPVR
jgi:hypothetical protein